MPKNPLIFNDVSALFFLLFLSLLLNGCDSNQGNKNSLSSQQKIQKYTQETTLTGKVSYKNKVINSGAIKATNNKGHLITSTSLNKNAHYSMKIAAGTKLPIILTYYPDKKTQKKLISVVIYSIIKKYDINELTTLIAKKAKALGGYSPINMVMAAESTVGVPDANKTTTGFRGDPTKQYGGWH